MDNSTKSTLVRIQDLQQAFAQNLAQRINELELLFQDLNQQYSLNHFSNQQNLKNIHDFSHKLAGSAGTFQFTAVYQAAKAIENFCVPLLDVETATQPKDWFSNIQPLFKTLKSATDSEQHAIFSKHITTSQYSEPEREDTRKANQILLVDDDELLASLIQTQAKHFGYQIDCLHHPEELATFLETHSPEVILMDIIFPNRDMTGIDLVRDLKATNKIHCPVIFLSSKEDFTTRLNAVRAGGDGYIMKPVDILELIEILDRHTYKTTDSHYHALIIGDDPAKQHDYPALLKPYHFSSKILTDASNVTEVLATFQPDIILLNVYIPDCSSAEVTEVIRQDNQYTHIPILYLDAYSEPLHNQLSADSFLDKNLSAESLISRILYHSQRSKKLHRVISRLRKDQLSFQSISHSLSDAIITLNKQGLIIFWNEGAEKMFGYSSLEVLGQSIEIIIPPKYRDKHRQGFHRLVSSNTEQLTKISIESQAITKAQKLIPIELTYTEWLSGKERFFTSIIRDISEHKAIEKSLKDKKNKLNAIIKNSAEGIITLDAHGIIEMANPKAQAIFAYTEEELIGKNVSILMPHSARAEHDHYLKHSVIHAKKVINKARELYGLRKDGSQFPMELNVAPMDIGHEKKFVGILHDITDRKNILETMRLAKQEAEQANQAKSQFLSSMSHELRTPLNAILGFTQLLQEDTVDTVNEDQRESLDHIFLAGTHLLTLINEILDLSKIESKQVDINLEPIDIIQVVSQVTNLISPQADKAQIKMITHLPKSEKLFVIADSSRIIQVINNLLTNAIKYNRSEGTVTIHFTEKDKRVRLSVTDTGLGIPEEMIPQVFEPFHRLGAEQKDIEGTGIGLTITKMLIEMMKGTIGLDNHIGEGCTFWIELEKINVDDKLSAPIVVNSAQSIINPQEQIFKVLYIEDNSANRLLIKKLISRKAQFSYHEASNGTTGMTAALAIEPDIILLDINLPDMSGYDVLQKLQAYSQIKSKIIIISANAMPKDLEKGKGINIFAYLTKPINSSELFAVINQALNEVTDVTQIS